MDRHGTSMLTMAVVVTALFALEFGLGFLPPLPSTPEGLERLADSPRFWRTLVANIALAVVAAWFTTRDQRPDEPESPP